MKALTISTDNISNNVVKVIRKSSCIDLPTAISKGVILETLKKRMMRGEVVKFVYQKLSGEIRTAIGTLQSDAVKAQVNGNGVPKDLVVCLPISTLRKWLGEVSRKKGL